MNENKEAASTRKNPSALLIQTYGLCHPRKLLLIVNLPGPFRWCQTPGAKALCEYPGSNQSSASWEVDICK